MRRDQLRKKLRTYKFHRVNNETPETWEGVSKSGKWTIVFGRGKCDINFEPTGGRYNSGLYKKDIPFKETLGQVDFHGVYFK